jgi:hypothetical protein
MAYSSDTAIAYARRWSKSRNPKYADFDLMGGDCTNFISQCLHAGGFTMNFTPVTGWYFNSLSSRSPSWSGVEQLYAFIVSNRGSGVRGRRGGVSQVQPGDVIQLSFDGVNFVHSLFVTDITSNGDPLICTHTYDSDSRALSSYSYMRARAILIDRL